MKNNRGAVGNKLRLVRKRLQVTGEELAEKLGITQATVSRFETGRIMPSVEYVERCCEALNLGSAERKELIQFTEFFLADYHRWGCEEDGTLTRLQHAVLEKEKRCKVFHTFQWMLIPGLFQTRAYIYSLFQLLGERDPDQLEKAVKMRIKRQKILEKPDRQFNVVLAENALHSGICSPEDKLVQLERIVELSHYNNIDIKVIPLAAPLQSACVNSFSIYDNKFAYVETMTAGFNVWEDKNVEVYKRQFVALTGSALAGDMAIEFISSVKQKIATEIGR